MTHAWPVIAIVVGLVRLVVVLARRRTPAGRAPRAVTSRAGATPALWTLIAWVCLGGTTLVSGLRALDGSPAAMLIFAGCVAVLAPWWVTRTMLVPLGEWRLVYYYNLLSTVTWVQDMRGGRALASALALCRRGEVNPREAAWVEERLAPSVRVGASPPPLRGAGVVSAGLLAFARGDIEAARGLIETLRWVDPRACPPAASRIASLWLAADALARGDDASPNFDRRVPRAAAAARRSRAASLLAALGAVERRSPTAPTRIALQWRWLTTPRPWSTWALVRHAEKRRRDPATTPAAPPPPRPEQARDEVLGPWAAALARHASLLTRLPEVSADDLRVACDAWGAVFDDPHLGRHLDARALSVGAPSHAAAASLAAARETVESELCSVARAAQVSPRALGEGSVARAVAAALRESVCADIEALSDALRLRVDEKRALPAVDELREWVTLRRAYERGVALCGDEVRRLVFIKVNTDVTRQACWLFNERGERALGNAMFAWLLDEAVALGLEQTVALQTKNVACGPLP